MGKKPPTTRRTWNAEDQAPIAIRGMAINAGRNEHPTRKEPRHPKPTEQDQQRHKQELRELRYENFSRRKAPYGRKGQGHRPRLLGNTEIGKACSMRAPWTQMEAGPVSAPAGDRSTALIPAPTESILRHKEVRNKSNRRPPPSPEGPAEAAEWAPVGIRSSILPRRVRQGRAEAGGTPADAGDQGREEASRKRDKGVHGSGKYPN